MVLFSLGTWQVFRRQEKLQIIEKMRATPINIPANIHLHSYKKVRATGTFMEESFRVFAGKQGYYHLQLFKLEDGRHILVNRGTYSGKTLPEVTNIKLQEKIEGILYCELSNKVKWVVNNDADENIWFWFDLENMAKLINVPLENCVVWGNSSTVAAGLKPNVAPILRNDHTEYAMTWYVLSVVWIAGYISFVKNRTSYKC